MPAPFPSAPTPSRQFNTAPTINRQTPAPPSKGSSAGKGVMYAFISTLVLFETVYIGASLIMEDSPAHVIIQRLNDGDAEAGIPKGFPSKYAPDEERIAFYKNYVDSFSKPQTKKALTELLPLLQAKEDWAAYNKYKAIFDVHFPGEK
jgi:hypothetical protein